MASFKRVVPDTPPETLPEDFSEWDEQSSSAAVHADSNGHSANGHLFVAPERHQAAEPTIPPPAAKNAKTVPPRKASEAELEVDAFLKRLREISPEPFEEHSGRRREANNSASSRLTAAPSSGIAAVPLTPPPPPSSQAKLREADQELFQLFRSGNFESEEENPDGEKKKKWRLIGAISLGSVAVLLAIVIPMVARGNRANAPKPAAAPVTSDSNLQGTDSQKPSPSVVPGAKVPGNAGIQQTYSTQQNSSEANVATATPVQSQMMNDQLNAPRQIPQGAVNKAPDEAPPPAGFHVADLERMGGSGGIGTAFNDQSKLKINHSTVAISAGVAGGLLIRKTAPIYPAFARTARVSGRVVLGATISKAGSIVNIHVMSGPPMLQQAAIAAVRNWVYKPYMLDNQPTEVETTINVDFALD